MHHASPTASLIETLEARRLLTTLEGSFFNDFDGNGLFDFFEFPLAGVTVFLDENNNGTLDDGERFTVTDRNGRYRFEDVPQGTYVVAYDPLNIDNPTYEPGDGILSPTLPGVGGRVVSPQTFSIDLDFRFAPTLDLNARLLLETAVNRWEQVIVGSLPQVVDTDFGLGVVDNLRIDVIADPRESDGPGGRLASAGPVALREEADGGLPYYGLIDIDPADIANTRGFLDTAIHEIGHVLGIGTLWEERGLTDFFGGEEPPQDSQELLDGPDDGPFFGEAARREKNTVFGIGPDDPEFEDFVIVEGRIPVPTRGPGGAITIERVVQPGSSYGHWDQETYDNELMTPFAAEEGFFDDPTALTGNPLSRFTIGSLEDLGYEVNYAAADPYGPLGIGALPGDFTGLGIDVRPYQLVVQITPDSPSLITGLNLGGRPNVAPAPFFFNGGPVVVAPGQPLRLLAEVDTTADAAFTGDVDFRDRVERVVFYRETNDTPGLQTPGDVRRGQATSSDLLVGEDFIGIDGRLVFETFVDTTDLPDGTYTFHAAAYDRFGAFTVRTTTVVVDSTQTAVPARPTDLRVVGRDTERFTVAFNDNSEDESGFVLQVADAPAGFEAFDDASLFDDIDGAFAQVRSIFIPAQEGTGRREVVVDLGEPLPNLTRFFRLRAFNTQGNTPFTGGVSARTLGTNEILIDDSDGRRVTLTGDVERVTEPGANALGFARGTTGTATFDPLFDAGFTGVFNVLANVPDADGLGRTRVSVVDGAGVTLGTRVLGDAQRGSQVLLGRFTLGEGARVVFEDEGDGAFFADAVRFLPSDARTA